MKIDISRVNLLEKDIEDWLFENPGALPRPFNENLIVRWIGRQYTLPSGIADLIGLRENNRVVVVEVKNVPINKAAVLQVCRYQDDLKHILSQRMSYPHVRDWNYPEIDMILVGPSIDSQTFTEARAVGVDVVTFSASFALDLSRLVWSHEHENEVEAQRDAIAKRPEWDIFGITVTEQVEIDMLERRLTSELEAAQDSDDDEPDTYSDIILA